MRRRSTISAFLLTCLATTTLHAQAPDSALRAFNSALADRSAEQLHGLLSDADGAIRKGLVALELQKRSGSADDAQQAARFFSAAVKSSPNEAWAHYGLGAILFRERKVMALVRTLGAADGAAMSVAQRELERALDLAPDFTEAADVLGTLALKTKDKRALERSRTVLTRSANSGEKVGRLDLALNDTAAILKRAPSNSMDQLRKAMVLFAKGDARAGADAYLAGVDGWNDAAAAAYIADVEGIASPEEAAALHAGTLNDRANALKLFWHKRSVRDGVSVAARIQEHYRRLALARKSLTRESSRGAPALGGLITAAPTGAAEELDDRGLIYLRYGEPYDKIIVRNTQTRPNETWVYLRPDGTFRSFRFVLNSGRSGWALIADPVQMLVADDNAYMRFKSLGTTAWTTLATDNNYINAMQVYDELSRYDPRLRLISGRIQLLRAELKMVEGRRPSASDSWRTTASDIYNDNVAWYEQYANVARSALKYDAAAPLFERPMLVFHDFATFRGNGCTDVLFTIATRAESYRVFINIADTLTWNTATVDTVVTKELPDNGYLRSTGVLCQKPSQGMYLRYTISSDSTTGMTAGGPLDIPDYSGSALMMSDLVFAGLENGPFVRGNAKLSLIPPRQFVQGAGFRLFYELYNVPRGHKYRTEITFTTSDLNPLAKVLKGKRKMTVSFDDEARADGVVQELRTLYPDVDPGKVDVTVKVMDLVSNQATTKSETIWILPAESQP